MSAAEAPSGTIVFTVSSTGDQVMEFYLHGEDGLRIVGEVENIGPGLSRDLVVQAKPGLIDVSVGNASFAVTDSDSSVAPIP